MKAEDLYDLLEKGPEFMASLSGDQQARAADMLLRLLLPEDAVYVLVYARDGGHAHGHQISVEDSVHLLRKVADSLESGTAKITHEEPSYDA